MITKSQRKSIKDDITKQYKLMASNLYYTYRDQKPDELRMLILSTITSHIAEQTVRRLTRKVRGHNRTGLATMTQDAIIPAPQPSQEIPIF